MGKFYYCKDEDNPINKCTWRDKETGECKYSRSCEHQTETRKKDKYNLNDHEWEKFKLHKKFDSTLTDEEILEIIKGTREMKKQLEDLKGS